MIKNLIKVAAELDKAGFHVEADLVDTIMQKVAEEAAEDNAIDFGFLGNKTEKKDVETAASDDTDDEEDENLGSEEEEEEEEEPNAELSFEDCLEHCKALTHEEQVAIIRAILDDMV